MRREHPAVHWRIAARWMSAVHWKTCTWCCNSTEFGGCPPEMPAAASIRRSPWIWHGLSARSCRSGRSPQPARKITDVVGRGIPIVGMSVDVRLPLVCCLVPKRSFRAWATAQSSFTLSWAGLPAVSCIPSSPHLASYHELAYRFTVVWCAPAVDHVCQQWLQVHPLAYPQTTPFHLYCRVHSHIPWVAPPSPSCVREFVPSRYVELPGFRVPPEAQQPNARFTQQ